MWEKKRKNKLLLVSSILTLLSLLVANSVFASGLINTESINSQTIPGIVEGTAKMIDTASYFAEKLPSEAVAGIKIVGDRLDTLTMKLGYKSPTWALPDTSKPVKEITIWAEKDLFPLNSESFAPIHNEREEVDYGRPVLSRAWNLLSVGFDNTDYPKADERIWYLKIERLPGMPYGTFQEDGTVDGGEAALSPFDDPLKDFEPFINCLLSFELTFGGLTFKTMFHPVFDGSKPVIIPIRGVNHELIRQMGTKEGESTKSLRAKSTRRNVLVIFVTVYGERRGITADDDGSAFMVGDFGDHPEGMVDYGWDAFYIMDGDTDYSNVLRTTAQLYYIMMLAVDAVTGANDQVLHYIQTHGILSGVKLIDGEWQEYGYAVMTGFSHGRSGAICENYLSDRIEAICDDSTWVFVWFKTCISYNFLEDRWHDWPEGGWTPSLHHNHLQMWGYVRYMAEIGDNFNDETAEWASGRETYDFFDAVGWNYNLGATWNHVKSHTPMNMKWRNFMGSYQYQFDLNLIS